MADASAADADRFALQRMVRGDHGAGAEVYDRHARLLSSLALRVVGRQPDAEDVLREVSAQVGRQAGRYDTSRGSVAGWLVMLTRSRALDRLRRERGEPPSADVDWAAIDVVDPGAGADLRLVTAEQAARLRAALEALPDAQRVPLQLGYYEGPSQSAIAGRPRVPPGPIKTPLRPALPP